MTMAARSQIGSLALALALVAVASSCREDPLIKPANQIPIADARVIRDGMSINERMDGGAAALTYPFTGAPVAITLDGSNSYDTDGTIVTYRWLSGTLPGDAGTEGGTPPPNDAGVVHRFTPPGEAATWPGEGMQRQVELGEGIWWFSLWVIDNDGAVSQPDAIKITIGAVVDPVVQQCADHVVSTEPDACRQCLCKQSDTCRTAVIASACDQTCWNLVNCVAANCPDFAAMAAKMDYSCLTANCSAYTGGSGGATPVAPCFNACPNDCMHVPISMGGSDGGMGGSDAAE
jgi:hypothetical protein